MVQVINDTSRVASTGQSLGIGLGQGLQALAEAKVNQYRARQQSQQTKAGLIAAGFDPEQAGALSGLDPSILGHLVKAKAMEPAHRFYAQQALGQGQEETPQTEPVEQQLAQQQLREPQVSAPQLPGLQNFFPALQENKAKAEKAQKTIQPAQEEAQLKAQHEKYGEVSPNQAKQLAKRQAEGKSIPPVLTERMATQLAKIRAQEKIAQEAQIGKRFQATKEDRKQIINDAKTAREDLRDLERLEDLEKEGKLDTPGYIEFLKRSGLDIPALMNEGSEEFQKIQANFQRNAKQYYGSRVSNFEIEQFLKTIPSLSQSPEGRKRVIANLKNIARTKLEYNNARKEIMAESKGIPPYDLQEQIEDRVEPKIDKLAEKFKADLAKPVPKGQNKLITALQAGAGALPGILKGGLKGAAAGAAIGSAVPGIGTTAGAISGGLLGALGG